MGAPVKVREGVGCSSLRCNMRQDRRLTDTALVGHDSSRQFLCGRGGSRWFAPFAAKLAEMADL